MKSVGDDIRSALKADPDTIRFAMACCLFYKLQEKGWSPEKTAKEAWNRAAIFVRESQVRLRA